MVVTNLEQLTDLPVHVAVVDEGGTIVAVNERWKEFGRTNGLASGDFGLGMNYYEVCEVTADPGVKLPELSAQLRELLAGRLALMTFAYPCDAPRLKRWFILIGLPITAPSFRGAALVHVDISELLQSTGLSYAAASGGWLDNRIQSDGTDWRRDLVSELEASFRRIIPELVSDGAARVSSGADGAKLDDRVKKALTARQQQILLLIGEGKTNPEIARALGTSPNTVKLHVSALLKRLNLKNRTEAAALAARLSPE